jgi:hypothetical protein
MMRRASLFRALILISLFGAAPGLQAQDALSNDHFLLRFNAAGIAGLKRAGDAFDTEYVARGRTLGSVLVRYRMDKGLWQEVSSATMADRRADDASAADRGVQRLFSFLDKYYLFEGDFNDHFADLEMTVRYRIEGDAFFWTIRLRNLSGQPLTIGDLALPLPMNTAPWWDKTEMYTKRLIPHSFVAGHGSFVFWMRPNGVGPFLVMTPLSQRPAFETAAGFAPAKLEFQDDKGVYIHALAAGQEAREAGGNWRQSLTALTLAPQSRPGSEAAYGFKFRWAADYEKVRDILCQEGLFDVNVVPGMTVPNDLEARFSIRSKSRIASVEAEFPDKTQIEEQRATSADRRIFSVRFSRLGENRLVVRTVDGRETQLEFFVTEPLETLIKKRADHLVRYQQHRDPNKWYNGLFSDWDMRAKVLRGPDDTDGLKDFWVVSDDPGLCKAPYIAAKNVSFPSAKEIEAVEYYIRNFLWGKLQQTDREEYPYGIFGIPNWKKHRESRPPDRDAWTGHLWRLADYPHIIVLYLNMARIAGTYPGLTKYLDRRGYLERAFGTAKAYFTVPLATGGWSAIELCRMNEMIIPSLIEELEAAGMKIQTGWLRERWEKKVEHYVNDGPNLLHAEYPGNPCAFESSQAIARYAMERAGRPGSALKVKPKDAARFLEEQIGLNISLRGWIEPAYYLLGISRPGTGFYMSHMGGWAVLDYALTYARDAAPALRLGYASYLGNWALENSGPAESNYGYWYPGPENDGAAAGAFVSTAFGEVQGKAVGRGAWFYGGEVDMGFGAALRTAATIVTDDPIFGPIAYGGDLAKTDGGTAVIPKDGLRQRFHVVRGERHLRLLFDRDGFAEGKPVEFADSFDEIRLALENRSGDVHEAHLTVSGLPAGTYDVSKDGRSIATFTAIGGTDIIVTLPVAVPERCAVTIKPIRLPGLKPGV